MMRKALLYISNAALISGAAMGVYVFVKIYLIKRRLPSGACPVTENRPMLYTAIVLCCISLVLSFFSPKDNEIKNPEK